MNLITPVYGLTSWITLAISIVIITIAVYRAPIKQLAAKSIRQHLWLGSIVGFGLFWALLGVNVQDSYRLHPVLIASATFIFGLELTLILGALALCITHVLAGISVYNIGINYIVSIVTPAVVINVIIWFISRLQIKNLFIYTLGGGFIGGMLSMLSMGIVSLIVFKLSSASLFATGQEHGYLFLLLMFPEGFCNGAIISTVTVLAPDWVKTYDDEFYLSRE